MKVESFEAIVRALHDANVPYLVVEGIAVRAYGYGRFTADVDLVISLRPDSVSAAFKALASEGYLPRIPVTAAQFGDAATREGWIRDKGMVVLNFHSDRHRETPVDVFVQEPFDFDAEFRRATMETMASGIQVRIVALDTLLAMKQGAGRLQDLADVERLRKLHEGGTP